MTTSYPTTYFFGLKGSGKSTLMVKSMKKDLKKGYIVYTNMTDVLLSGVRFFDIKDLGKCVPAAHSSIYIDEAALCYSNRNFKNFSEDMESFIALARHHKCKVTLNSQAFDIDKKIRDRVDYFRFIKRIGPFSLIRPMPRKFTPNDGKGMSDSPIVSSYAFKHIFSWRLIFIPRYFKLFNSFVVDKPRPELPYWVSSDLDKKTKNGALTDSEKTI